MNLYINRSKATHILNNFGSPFGLVVGPNEVFDRRQTSVPVDQFSYFEKFDISQMYDIDTVVLVREYALGDLIQLIPVVREFKKKKNVNRVIISTADRFVTYLSKLFSDITFSTLLDSSHTKKIGIKVNLNGVLEADHSLQNEQRNVHRVSIYSDFLGMSATLDEDDWGVVMKKKVSGKLFFNEADTVIAVQIRGSGKMKTLPYEFVRRMSLSVAAMGYKVLLIDQDASKGFEGKNIINACGKMNIIDIVANLEKCKCVLTMDSGVLWLAHVANCPVIAFLGSTRASERISLHPQYPEKAISINLAEHIGCTPCFETCSRCKGSIDCMNKFDHDIILKHVHENINLILKGDIATWPPEKKEPKLLKKPPQSAKK